LANDRAIPKEIYTTVGKTIVLPQIGTLFLPRRENDPMKSIYKKLSRLKKKYADDYAGRLSILMLLFFLLFGTVSLYFLLQSPS